LPDAFYLFRRFARLDDAIPVGHHWNQHQISGSDAENCGLVGKSRRIDQHNIAFFGFFISFHDDLVVIDAG
jgi:hypothetical protein